jgi:hypothetical protein
MVKPILSGLWQVEAQRRGESVCVSRRKAGLPIGLFLFATIGGVFAGYGVSTVRSTWASVWGDANSSGVQMSNVIAKSDHLASLIRSAITIPETRRYALPAATTGADLERLFDMVTEAAPMMPMEPAPSAAPLEPRVLPSPVKTAAVAAPAKPKLPPPPQPMGLLDDGQIAGIKSRLKLTPEQAQYWPAVETALRSFAKMQLREMRRNRNASGKINIDVNSPEVQQLIWAAMPLLGQLHEDQKSEVRRLVRIIGLEQVASRI